jgi:hypothetical protein
MRKPGVVAVALVRMRVRRVRKCHACRARKCTEVIVEGVILLGDDEHMIDGEHDRAPYKQAASAEDIDPL